MDQKSHLIFTALFTRLQKRKRISYPSSPFTHSVCVDASKDNGRCSCYSDPISRVHSHGEGGVDIGMGIDGTRHDLEASHHCTQRSIGDG